MSKISVVRAKSTMMALFIFLLSFSLMSCDELIGQTCEEFDIQYKESKKRDGQLKSIQPDGAYSMALVLNQTAVNKMFDGVSKYKLPSIPFLFESKIPRLELGNEHFDSSDIFVNIPIVALGQEVNVYFSFPLVGAIVYENGQPVKTQAIARMSKATLRDAFIKGGNTKYSMLPAVKSAITTFFRLTLGDYVLFELNAWKIGQNAIQLVAGAVPDIDPVHHTLTFGMYTNLIDAPRQSIEWSKDFPSGAEVGLHMHPNVIRAMIARMMSEGEVPTTVREQNQNSDTAGFGITMNEMDQIHGKPEHFNLGFRLWRTSGSLCGFADVVAGFLLSVDNNKFKFKLADDSLKIVNSGGWVALFTPVVNTLTDTEFFKKVIDVAEFTLNFDQIHLTDKGKTDDPSQVRQASLKAMDGNFQLKADGNGISVYLNLL